MNKIWQYVTYGLIIIFIVFLGAYAKIWEKRQTILHMKQVKVLSIEPYSTTNDFHWSYKGYRIYIAGEERLIDFALKNWDNTVQINDTVDVAVRRSFSWFGLKNELDGLIIDDYE